MAFKISVSHLRTLKFWFFGLLEILIDRHLKFSSATLIGPYPTIGSYTSDLGFDTLVGLITPRLKGIEVVPRGDILARKVILDAHLLGHALLLRNLDHAFWD